MHRDIKAYLESFDAPELHLLSTIKVHLEKRLIHMNIYPPDKVILQGRHLTSEPVELTGQGMMFMYLIIQAASRIRREDDHREVSHDKRIVRTLLVDKSLQLGDEMHEAGYRYYNVTRGGVWAWIPVTVGLAQPDCPIWKTELDKPVKVTEIILPDGQVIALPAWLFEDTSHE